MGGNTTGNLRSGPPKVKVVCLSRANTSKRIQQAPAMTRMNQRESMLQTYPILIEIEIGIGIEIGIEIGIGM